MQVPIRTRHALVELDTSSEAAYQAQHNQLQSVLKAVADGQHQISAARPWSKSLGSGVA